LRRGRKRSCWRWPWNCSGCLAFVPFGGEAAVADVVAAVVVVAAAHGDDGVLWE
jgi:hypothetical protein